MLESFALAFFVFAFLVFFLAIALTAPLADCPRLCHLWVDAGYRGRFVDWVETTLTWSVEVVQHWWTGVRAVWVAEGAEPPRIPAGFHVLPRRWVVERTFAWLGRYRRLSKDDEALPGTEEAWIFLARARLMLARTGTDNGFSDTLSCR